MQGKCLVNPLGKQEALQLVPEDLWKENRADIKEMGPNLKDGTWTRERPSHAVQPKIQATQDLCKHKRH